MTVTQRSVRSIVDVFVREASGGDVPSSDSVYRFVDQSIGAFPVHLRIPFCFLSVLFSRLVLRRGATKTPKVLSNRALCDLPVVRDLLRTYRSLTFFAYYSEREEAMT
ncbi:MAG: hypothetical protein AAF517_18295 [Planctomycetota bacterium]